MAQRIPPTINRLDLAFGGDMKKLLPPKAEIPEEFWDRNVQTKWSKFITTWFYQGIKSAELTPKEGVDKNQALDHIGAILASFEPKHEHKMAACAYLMSEYFSDIGKYEPSKSFNDLLGKDK